MKGASKEQVQESSLGKTDSEHEKNMLGSTRGFLQATREHTIALNRANTHDT